MSWIPDWAVGFTIGGVADREGVTILFYGPGEGTRCIPIEQLPVMLSRDDVVQQIKDRPLEERILTNTNWADDSGRSKYHREIKRGVWVDVYEVLGAFTGHYSARVKPMVDHLLKKLLAGGERGHKDLRQDMVDVRDSAQRAIDTIDEWA